MEFLSDPHFWGKWVSIVLLDIVLAGDNALALGWWFARGTARTDDAAGGI